MAFTCNYCNKNFSQKNNLKRHIKSKHEATNLRCEKCEFTSDRIDCLKRHIEMKHYQNKIKCPECSAEFSRKDNMERHKKEYHPIDPLALMENHSTPIVDPTPTVVAPTPEQASDTEVPTPYQTFDNEVSAFNKRLVEKKWFIRLSLIHISEPTRP